MSQIIEKRVDFKLDDEGIDRLAGICKYRHGQENAQISFRTFSVSGKYTNSIFSSKDFELLTDLEKFWF
jgi:hypothetical protein